MSLIQQNAMQPEKKWFRSIRINMEISLQYIIKWKKKKGWAWLTWLTYEPGSSIPVRAHAQIASSIPSREHAGGGWPVKNTQLTLLLVFILPTRGLKTKLQTLPSLGLWCIFQHFMWLLIFCVSSTELYIKLLHNKFWIAIAYAENLN